MTKIYKYLEDVFAIVGFFIIVGIFFSPTILQGKLPVPLDSLVGLYHPWRDLYKDTNPRGVPFKNFLITDPVRQQIPWRKIAIDQWKRGQVPSWNPYNFSGMPTLANIQAAALYPLNILFLIFPFIDAWTMLVMLQPLLAGLFMYWYLRSLPIRPIACLLGAIAWSFSGFNIAWLTWGTMGHVALWLPLALLSIDKLFQLQPFVIASEAKPCTRRYVAKQSHKGLPRLLRSLAMTKNNVWSVVFVASLVFQFFAGHAQISLYFFLVVIAYGLMRVLQAKERRKAILLFVLLLSASLLLTAIQWMPLLDWIRQSSRVIDGANWNKEGWFIPWAHLVQFVAPDFFGNPTTLNYWGQWNYGEFVGYIGVLPLLFAVSAVISRRARNLAFWIAILVVTLLFALPTPLAYLPFMLKVPILSSLQPTRLLFVVDFSLAVLAAFGCHAWLEGAKKGRWVLVVALVGVLLAILWGVSVVGSLEVSTRNLVLPTVLFIVSMILLIIYQRLRQVTMFRNIVTWSFVALVAVDLLRFGWKFTPFTPRDYFFPETKVLSFLKQQPRPFRIMSVDKRILPPNTASYFGIESTEGYDPIVSARYEAFMAAVARGEPNLSRPYGFNRIISVERIDSALLSLLNVRYVLTLSETDSPLVRKVYQEGETRVYELIKSLPRAYLVSSVRVEKDEERIIRLLYTMTDFTAEAIVEEPIDVTAAPLAPDESIAIVSYRPDALYLSTITKDRRMVVVANTYNRGTRAWVDDVETLVYRVNFAFEGIVVPAGNHRVMLRF